MASLDLHDSHVEDGGADDPPISHNLLGQRLGRKGRNTRERILAAAERLLGALPETPISLSAVAREASLGMTTLYLYFSDLTELLLAILERIMAQAEESHGAHLRDRWPDATLEDECRRFVDAYHAFWRRHTGILHLRNTLADGGDERMLAHRISVSQPLIVLLLCQMDHDPEDTAAFAAAATASVLLTGVERVVTIATDPGVPGSARDISWTLKAQARILALAIADMRMSAHH